MPNQPQGYPDISSYGYGGGMGPSQGGYRPAGGQQQGSDYVTPEQWDQYINTLKQAYQASAGFERMKLQSQIDDAEKGRQNSLQIARLQGDNSRYGVDQQRLTAIEQLKQRDKEFAQTHALDTRKADISEAQLISSQRSEPNRLFQTMDLEQALSSIRNGGKASIAPRPGVAAVDHLSSDYTGNPYLAGGGARTQTSSAGGDMMPGQSAASGVGTNTTAQAADQRLKAARAVMEALPPSATEGLDPTGVSALNAVYALYQSPLRPGTLESLSPTQKAGLQSGAQRVQQYTGRSYDDFVDEYRKSLPGQGAVNRA